MPFSKSTHVLPGAVAFKQTPAAQGFGGMHVALDALHCGAQLQPYVPLRLSVHLLRLSQDVLHSSRTHLVGATQPQPSEETVQLVAQVQVWPHKAVALTEHVLSGFAVEKHSLEAQGGGGVKVTGFKLNHITFPLARVP